MIVHVRMMRYTNGDRFVVMASMDVFIHKESTINESLAPASDLLKKDGSLPQGSIHNDSGGSTAQCYRIVKPTVWVTVCCELAYSIILQHQDGPIHH